MPMNLGLTARPTRDDVFAAEAEARRLHAEVEAAAAACTLPGELTARMPALQVLQARADAAADVWRRLDVAYRELAPDTNED